MSESLQADLEEDPMLRQNVNIYLDKNRIPVTEEEDGKALHNLADPFIRTRIQIVYTDPDVVFVLMKRSGSTLDP